MSGPQVKIGSASVKIGPPVWPRGMGRIAQNSRPGPERLIEWAKWFEVRSVQDVRRLGLSIPEMPGCGDASGPGGLKQEAVKAEPAQETIRKAEENPHVTATAPIPSSGPGPLEDTPSQDPEGRRAIPDGRHTDSNGRKWNWI